MVNTNNCKVAKNTKSIQEIQHTFELNTNLNFFLVQ